MKTEGGLTLKFLQDLDDDRIDAAQEYILGSSDTDSDTDDDGLPDAFEYFGYRPDPANPAVKQRWTIDVAGKPMTLGFASPARPDSDLDGLSDADEFNPNDGLDTDDDHHTQTRRSRDPRNPDTDGDGVSDYDEVKGYTIELRFPEPNGLTVITKKSDPLNPDTDGDTLRDGDERTLGTNPRRPDADKVRDDDGDGLVNFVEDDGWKKITFATSTTPYAQGDESVPKAVTSRKDDPDSDDDTLTDKEEYDLKTDPTEPDSDGVPDADEFDITLKPDGSRTLSKKYDPHDADVDNDLRSDGDELTVPIRVRVYKQAEALKFSDPTLPDADNDDLVDGGEILRTEAGKVYGTDPTNAGTDNSGVTDGKERELGTDPLWPDQMVILTLTQLQLTGFEGTDGSDGDFTLEIEGKINFGQLGSLSNLIEINKDLKNNDTVNLNYSTAPFRLYLDGPKWRLENNDFKDNDITEDDHFSYASKDFTYEGTSGDDSISSYEGQNVLTTSFNLRIKT